MATRAKVRLTGRFPAGTKVGLYRDRIGGGSLAADDDRLSGAFKTATVGKDQTVEFDGLDEGESLFVGGYVEDPHRARMTGAPVKDWRSVAVTAQVQQRQRVQTEAEIRESLAGTLSPDQREPDRTSVGVKGTRKSTTAQGQPFSSPMAGIPSENLEGEQVPHLRQEDAADVEQRSATITGQATPVNPDEQVPKPAQVDGIDLEQRSATPLGELTPVSPGEQVPRPSQAAFADAEQRSATPHGQAEPVPQGDPVEIQRAKESSAAKAIGAPADSSVVQAAVDSDVFEDGELDAAEKPQVGEGPSQQDPVSIGEQPVNQSAAAVEPDTDVKSASLTALRARASELEIEGRSKMSRRQLQNAVKKAEGQS